MCRKYEAKVFRVHQKGAIRPEDMLIFFGTHFTLLKAFPYVQKHSFITPAIYIPTIHELSGIPAETRVTRFSEKIQLLLSITLPIISSKMMSLTPKLLPNLLVHS